MSNCNSCVVKKVFRYLFALMFLGGLVWGIFLLGNPAYECNQFYGVYGFLIILIGVVAGGFWQLFARLDKLLEEQKD